MPRGAFGTFWNGVLSFTVRNVPVTLQAQALIDGGMGPQGCGPGKAW